MRVISGAPDRDGAEGLAPAPLVLLHVDARCLAVAKPAGLLVHPSALDARETDTVLSRLAQQGLGPLWTVHRLDKGTSGVLLLARDAEAARRLGAAFAANAADDAPGVAGAEASAVASAVAGVIKRYRALVRGWPAERGEIAAPLARDPELPSTGQAQLPACTRWQRLQRLEWPLATDGRHASTRLALVAVQPLTGRRHQIRRHFKALAHPLIGDATHGKGPLNRAIAAHLGIARLWLHAEQLTVPHPDDGRALVLRAPLGDEWQALATLGALDADGPQPKRAA